MVIHLLSKISPHVTSLHANQIAWRDYTTLYPFERVVLPRADLTSLCMAPTLSYTESVLLLQWS